jgi:hypothetical protein
VEVTVKAVVESVDDAAADAERVVEARAAARGGRCRPSTTTAR